MHTRQIHPFYRVHKNLRPIRFSDFKMLFIPSFTQYILNAQILDWFIVYFPFFRSRMFYMMTSLTLLLRRGCKYFRPMLSVQALEQGRIAIVLHQLYVTWELGLCGLNWRTVPLTPLYITSKGYWRITLTRISHYSGDGNILKWQKGRCTVDSQTTIYSRLTI